VGDLQTAGKNRDSDIPPVDIGFSFSCLKMEKIYLNYPVLMCLSST
jgi:hypothetical protein